jgi:integrase
VESTKAVYEQKKPFTEDEILLIMAEAGKLNGGTTGYATKGPTLQLLLELMEQTGLRVSDAVRYDPAKCTKAPKQWLYTFEPVKQTKESLKKYVTAYLSPKLKAAIDKAEWFSKALPFAYHSPDKSERADLEQAVYERMQNIGERCGVTDCRPHRLRHTFAVRKLSSGVSMGDLSEMLGHSSVAITQKYYSFWDPRRNDRLALVALKSRSKS